MNVNLHTNHVHTSCDNGATKNTPTKPSLAYTAWSLVHTKEHEIDYNLVNPWKIQVSILLFTIKQVIQ